MTEEEFEEKLNLFLNLMDPAIYYNVRIPKYDLEFRVTKTVDAICERSSYYNLRKELIKNGYLIENQESKTFILTEKAWQTRNELSKNKKQIPNEIEEMIEEIIEIMRNLPIPSLVPMELMTWTEIFTIGVKKFFIKIEKIPQKSKLKYVIAIALICWNDFYQKNLIKTKELLDCIDECKELYPKDIYLVCKFFGWNYFTLDNNYWFTSRDFDWLKENYKNLMRFKSYSKYPQLINNGRDTAPIDLSIFNSRQIKKISKKACESLINDILSQEIHNWGENYRENKKILYVRMEAMDIIRLE